MPLSDSRPDRHQMRRCESRPRAWDGSPTLHKIPSRHAVPITPVDRNRWVGYGPAPLQPSPNIGRVGVHDCPFGAFSGFTRVTACQVAAALAAYICPQSFSRWISPTHCLGSYRDEPTISRAGLPPAGILRPRGAPISEVPQFSLWSKYWLCLAVSHIVAIDNTNHI